MRVTTITARAGRKFLDPRVNFASLFVSVTLTGELEPGDSEARSLVDLQGRADLAAEDEKQRVLQRMSAPQPQWSTPAARTQSTADALAERYAERYIDRSYQQ